MNIKHLLGVYLNDKNHRELMRYALMLTGNRNDAEDLLSDLVVKIYTNANMLSALDPLPYLKRCLRNIHINQSIRAARESLVEPKRLEHLPQELEHSQKEYDYRQTVSDLEHALTPYPGVLVDAFIKYHLHGYSINELAISLGMKANSLAQRFRRMRVKMRQRATLLQA